MSTHNPPTRRRVNDYTQEHRDRAMALLATGASFADAGRAVGAPKGTVFKWTKQADELTSTEQTQLPDLGDLFETHARQALHAAGGKMEQADYKALMVGAAIAYDKSRLARGEPGQIVEHLGERDHRRDALIDAIARALGDRQAAAQLPDAAQLPAEELPADDYEAEDVPDDYAAEVE